MFKADHAHGVSRPKFAVRGGHEFGHEKETEPLGTVWRTGDAGKHQVHDVLGQIAVAPGNVDLLPGHLVCAVRLRFGLGAQAAEIGAGLRFCQVHGARPFA